jgi:hypothetical protein
LAAARHPSISSLLAEAEHPGRLERLAGQGEGPALHRSQPAHVIGVQVRDHHGVQVIKADAQEPGVVGQRRVRPAAGQT